MNETAAVSAGRRHETFELFAVAGVVCGIVFHADIMAGFLERGIV